MKELIRHRYLEIYLTLFVVSLISIVGYFGFFDYLNNSIYSKTISMTSDNTSRDTQFLLIELNEKEVKQSSEAWNNSLNKILKFDPKSFVFLIKTQSSTDILNSFSKNIPLYFATTLDRYLDNKGLYYKIKDQNYNIDERYKGFISMPKSTENIYLFYQDFFNTNSQKYNSLERKIVKDFSLKGANQTLGKYYINFSNSSIPIISFSKLIKDGTIYEIIKDKHIIFGYEKRYFEAGFNTPLENSPITYLEFFGYSFSTILNNNEIYYVDGWMKLLIVCAFIFIWIVLNKLLKIKHSFMTVLIIIFFIYFLLWILLNYFYIWIPFIEILLIILSSSYIQIWYRLQKKEFKENRLISNYSQKIGGKTTHETFFNSDKYWIYLSNIIIQTLNLEKIIFLEKVEDEHRLNEIHSVNCNFDDILEQRRDYEREPYKSAVSQQKPIMLESRHFFKESKDNEIEYMVPLIYSGKVMGFWAFTIDKNSINDMKNFNLILEKFSKELSGILYKRYEWINKNTKKPWHNIVKIYTKDETFTKINLTLSIFEKKINLLESLVNKFDNAIILYNIFGSVTHINKNMQLFCDNIDILPFNITPKILFSNLCDLSLKETASIFRKAIFTKDKFYYDIKHPLVPQNKYMLKGTMIFQEDLGDSFQDTFFFNSYGILIEIIDISLYKNKFDSNQDIQLMENNIYPVDIYPYINKAIERVSTELSTKDLKIIVTKDDNLPLIFLNFSDSDIEEMMIIFIKCLIDDAIENSKITIDIKKNQDSIDLILKDEGFGLPDKKFQRMLSSNDENRESIYIKLQEIIKKISDIEGKVIAYSYHGEGIVFTISLKVYN